MPDVLDYSSHENLPTGLRIEADGPVTRLYFRLNTKWVTWPWAFLFFTRGLTPVVMLGLLFFWFRRTFRPTVANLQMWQQFTPSFFASVFYMAAGVGALFWERKWGRTPHVLEASPNGLTSRAPGLWRFGHRFIPRDKISRMELKRAHSWTRRLPDRLTLVVHRRAKSRWRGWNLSTCNIDDAQRARDALAKALGLP